MLVCVEENVPAEITALTGLSAAELQQGTEPREALNSFLLFIGKDPLVGHNIAFDLEFLRMTCRETCVKLFYASFSDYVRERGFFRCSPAFDISF